MKKRRRATASLCGDQLGCAGLRIQPQCRSSAVSIYDGRHARVRVWPVWCGCALTVNVGNRGQYRGRNSLTPATLVYSPLYSEADSRLKLREAGMVAAVRRQ